MENSQTDRKIKRCPNCPKLSKKRVCSICQKDFCHFCVDNFTPLFAPANFSDKTSKLICYGCRSKELISAGNFESQMKDKFGTDFDTTSKTVKEPSWEPLSKFSNCEICQRRLGSKKYVCECCGDFLCSECHISYKGGKMLFRYPFYKTNLKRSLCHQCYYQINSGDIKIDSAAAVCPQNKLFVLFDFCEQKVPVPPAKNSSAACKHCEKKIKKPYGCNICGGNFCKVCTDYYKLPVQFDITKNKIKNLNIVCFDCRNAIFAENGKMCYYNALHKNSKIDFDKKIFRVPTWEKPDDQKFCRRCNRVYVSNKRIICGLCADIYCKKCIEKCEDPSDVFFDPYDIYNFNICFECRYYKLSGYETNDPGHEYKMEKMINKSFLKSNESEKNEIQSLFEEKFDKTDELVMDFFNCFLKKTMLTLGKMFITKNNICFFSNVFKSNLKITIPIKNILNITLVGLIKNEFKIHLRSTEENGPTKYSFMFVSVFNANKHLVFLESIVKSQNIEFNKATVFSKRNSSSVFISSEENKSSDVPESFEMLKNISLKKIFSKSYPVDDKKFYRFAFSDEALFSLVDFYHGEKGHSDFISTKWNRDDPVHSRSISFTYEISGIPKVMRSFSPKTSVVRSEQLIRNSESFSICANIQMPEMTYGEHFEVFHLYQVKKTEERQCTATIYYGINFKKPVPFIQGKISKRSLSDNTESLKRFFDKIEENLQEKTGLDVVRKRGMSISKGEATFDAEKVKMQKQIKLLKIALAALFVLWMVWLLCKLVL